MKKVLFFAFFALLLTTMAQAQISLGVKGGVTFSKFGLGDGLNDVVNSKFRLGFVTGALIEVPLGGRFAIQAEILYAQKGQRLETKRGITQTFIHNPPMQTGLEITDISSGQSAFLPSLSLGTVWNYKLSYIDIPLLFKYKFRGNTIGSSIYLGLDFGFGNSANVTLDDLKDPTSGKSELNNIENAYGGKFNDPIKEEVYEFGSGIFDQYKSFDFGAIAGFGLNYNLGSGSIVLDARFLLGLSNIDNSGNENNSLKNRSAQLTLGYMYTFGSW